MKPKTKEKEMKTDPSKSELQTIKQKIKHLRTTFLQFVREKTVSGVWTDELEEDFKIIEQFEFEYGIRKRLLPGDMKLCDELCNKYRLEGKK